MRLTDLVHDPYEGFDESDEPTAAEREGRAAVREALEGLRKRSQDSPAQRDRRNGRV